MRRQRWSLRTGVVLAAILAACTGGGAKWAGDGPVERDVRRVVVDPGAGAVVTVADGVEIDIAPGDLDGPGTVTVSASTVEPFRAAWFTAAGPPIEIHISAQLASPVTLSFSAESPIGGAFPVILRHGEAHGWYPVAATAVGDDAVVERLWFSPHMFGWAHGITEFVADTARGVLGDRSDPLQCSGPPPWAELSAPAQDVVHTCATTNVDSSTGTERVEVQLRNNRGVVLEVVVPAGVAYAFVDGQPEVVRRAVRDLTGQDSVLLPPGGFMTVGFAQPAVSRVDPITVTLSPFGLVFTLLEQLAGNDHETLFGLLTTLRACTGVPIPSPLDVTPTVDNLVDAVGSLLTCAGNLLTDPASVATLAVEHLAGLVGRTVSDVIADASLAARADALAGRLRFVGAAVAVLTIGADVIDVVADLYGQTATSGINSMSPLIGLRGSAPPPTTTTTTAPPAELIVDPGGAGDLRIGMSLDEALASGLVRDPRATCTVRLPVPVYTDLAAPHEGIAVFDDDSLQSVLITSPARTTPGDVAIGDGIDEMTVAFEAAGAAVTVDYAAAQVFGSYFWTASFPDGSTFSGSVDPATGTVDRLAVPSLESCD